MVKYRLLTQEELLELKKEFIDFLVLNGISVEEWAKFLAHDVVKTQKIIDLFSDVVFEKILRKVEYILLTTKNEIISFHCKLESIEMVGLVSQKGADVDFTNPEYISKVMSNPTKGLESIISEKAYTLDRELEIFNLTTQGGIISDGKVFQAIKSVI